MPAKKHFVTLTPEQRQQVEIAARSNKRSIRERQRARILLLADTNHAEGGLEDARICQQVGACRLTVQRVRQRFAAGGLAIFAHPHQSKISLYCDKIQMPLFGARAEVGVGIGYTSTRRRREVPEVSE